MKKSIFIAAFLLCGITGFAQNYYPSNKQRSTSNNSYSGSNQPSSTRTTQVNGYTRRNGTYVEGYNRTQQNTTNTDNYSTTGNSNPYTQQNGTKAADYSRAASNYGQGRTIQTGERGGQYYINDSGRKVYVPKQ